LQLTLGRATISAKIEHEMRQSRLVLKDGTQFSGKSPEWQTETYSGEVVFSTGMTGYVESLTDPSFAGQILTFTYPLIGNYGVPSQEEWESAKIAVAGVILSESCLNWSHHAGLHSLADWLQSQGVPLICGVDTRALTKRLRSAGSTLGAITTEEGPVKSFYDPNEVHLVAQVSPHLVKVYPTNGAKKRVIAVDCGMKENILRLLRKLPIEVVHVPHNYDYTNDEYDAVFLSNGPGDPAMAVETIEVLKKAMAQEKKVFGICLGTQLLALAAGAKTYKLPFGHRGHNQPCIERKSGRCFITSQNHGYAIDEESLPEGWEVTFHNLNDGSVEGIAHKSLPFRAVQFHPEASPGPTDTQWLFEEFYTWISG
jgi:carbamoyl-phosphate synthase small subunit